MANSTALNPWEWPESHWRRRINKVRAGKALRPMWPGGKRCAFAISFDVDHESNELRRGGRSLSRLSWGQYGSRRGMPRALELLRKYDVPASFFVPAVIAQLYPDEQRAVVDEGHEIGMHGWIHELNSELSAESERSLMMRSADTLEKITSKRPTGIRTPSWDFSDATLRIIRETGLTYDSSLMADDSCYELLEDEEPTGVIEIPVEWIRDDATYLWMSPDGSSRPDLSVDDVLSVFIREFEGAYQDADLFQLTLHPHVIGYRSRIWIVEELIRRAKAKGDVWFATHHQVAERASSCL
ncbi:MULTISPECIES: polysaccharide deacetylase [Mesorhizobium]|uniref:polysaccharide deacetylase family protein n=1 Tax=Mesorhizobium TaxID=68287 RepID=UPI000A4FA841|nr:MULTISPECIES: polysaccharide deacetylase [Mesorhizobium]WIE92735.1 polysaccharide deacetylase [Mesorhizobium sp. WSM4875]MBZ9798555.1 polysaccharide deacetylase [Mesorhizobium sp. ES1-4]MDF3211890.1 polysaccharide deacetylase [Mesorhizobium sp. LMG15046]MDF3234297.1 polysaccharide deacetylase [Mesorhizobium sp. DSM 30133]MDG4856503.1 polysaccharide deacetylase [Mesorhizobium sp. WSM4982]